MPSVTGLLYGEAVAQRQVPLPFVASANGTGAPLDRPGVLSLGTVAAALVARNAETRAGRTADAADVRVVDHLVGWLRRLVAADDPAAGTALARFEADSTSYRCLQELAQVLDRRAAADTGFRSDLEALIGRGRAVGIDLDSITQRAWGNPDGPAPSPPPAGST